MKKYALVTGASQGLGLSLCAELLKRGYFVAALSRTISKDLKSLEGDSLQIIQCDVSDAKSVEQAGKELKADKLDIIFNNAGIWLDRSRKTLLDPEFTFDTMLDQYQVNAVGVLRIAKEFMPKLLAGEGKVMVNVSSEAGSIGNCGRNNEYGYCMSKAAQNMATKILTNDFSSEGIKFYAVHPGWMRTPQGFAGGNEQYQPQQEPNDTAKVLIDWAEGTPKDGIYYDIDGSEMTW